MTYHLSNRQRKELHERGRPLAIAIPAPHVEDLPDDLRRWAARQLPDEAALISDVDMGHVLVDTESDVTGGLSERYGPLVDEWRDGGTLCVAVVVVRLTPRRVRHAPYPVQWPGCHVMSQGESE